MGTRNRKIAIFSFFSGGGFLDLGFEDLGCEIVHVNEINPSFMGAYKYSRARMGAAEPRFGYGQCSIDGYLTATRMANIRKQISELRGEGFTVGFIGGPPCPDFSVGGKNRGSAGDNGRLSRSYVDLILGAEPDFFLFENVKGLWRTKKHREFYDTLKADLRSSGYKCNDRLTNAIEYGAPQDRDRILLVGTSSALTAVARDLDWGKFLLHPGRSAFAHAWPGTDGSDAGDLSAAVPKELTVGHWFSKNAVKTHPNSRHHFIPRGGLVRFAATKEGDVSRKSYKRLHRNRYSPTAAYGNNEVHIHPTENRRISAAEALAIQSMPAAYELSPDMTLSAMFKLIGNGVPYLLAKGAAETILDAIE